MENVAEGDRRPVRLLWLSQEEKVTAGGKSEDLKCVLEPGISAGAYPLALGMGRRGREGKEGAKGDSLGCCLGI